jgi:hypothetical protein
LKRDAGRCIEPQASGVQHSHRGTCDKDKLLRAMSNLTVDMRGLRGGPIEWTETNHYRKVNLYKVYRARRAA